MVGNVAVTFATIVISIEVGAAQLPATGVNVYDVVPSVEVLITAGFHDPFTPSFEDAGSVGGVAF